MPDNNLFCLPGEGLPLPSAVTRVTNASLSLSALPGSLYAPPLLLPKRTIIRLANAWSTASDAALLLLFHAPLAPPAAPAVLLLDAALPLPAQFPSLLSPPQPFASLGPSHEPVPDQSLPSIQAPIITCTMPAPPMKLQRSPAQTAIPPAAFNIPTSLWPVLAALLSLPVLAAAFAPV
ncbi:hypothetical protein AX14_001047 [Amanita brunnescens Koide BX004]|nr:hypothetical protein AX14_001047 [Amanita brunnescens Koide BX004]